MQHVTNPQRSTSDSDHCCTSSYLNQNEIIQHPRLREAGFIRKRQIGGEPQQGSSLKKVKAEEKEVVSTCCHDSNSKLSSNVEVPYNRSVRYLTYCASLY